MVGRRLDTSCNDIARSGRRSSPGVASSGGGGALGREGRHWTLEDTAF